MWSTHTCFKYCRSPADCLLGFDDDNREQCTKKTKDQGIYCLISGETACENYVMAGEICLDHMKTICLNWSFIVLAIFLGNTIQTTFEAAMLYSLEVTFKPTSLEKLQYPE